MTEPTEVQNETGRNAKIRPFPKSFDAFRLDVAASLHNSSKGPSGPYTEAIREVVHKVAREAGEFSRRPPASVEAAWRRLVGGSGEVSQLAWDRPEVLEAFYDAAGILKDTGLAIEDIRSIADGAVSWWLGRDWRRVS